MNLYVRVSGDKASGQWVEKGQGGQSCVRMDIYDSDQNRIACVIARYDKHDGQGATTVEAFQVDHEDVSMVMRIEKGKKQKSERIGGTCPHGYKHGICQNCPEFK